MPADYVATTGECDTAWGSVTTWAWIQEKPLRDTQAALLAGDLAAASASYAEAQRWMPMFRILLADFADLCRDSNPEEATLADETLADLEFFRAECVRSGLAALGFEC